MALCSLGCNLAPQKVATWRDVGAQQLVPHIAGICECKGRCCHLVVVTPGSNFWEKVQKLADFRFIYFIIIIFLFG